MKTKSKSELKFKRIPIVIHPFNNHVDSFISINGVTLQNIPLSKFGKMGLSKATEKPILFDFLQAFRPWNDEETGNVDKILSYYKTMCKVDKHFNTKCLFVGNSERIREIMRISGCPSKMIMLTETLESAALMTKLNAN
jgi:hypothetical protein